MAWQDADITGGKVRLKHSRTSSETLGASGLVPGEIAINAADKKILFKDSSGAVQSIPRGATTTVEINDINGQHYVEIVNGLITSWSAP